MLIAGAKRLASLSPAIQAASHPHAAGPDTVHADPHPSYSYEGESLLPDFGAAPGVNFEIGVAVAQQAVLEGTATADWAKRCGSGEDFAMGEVRDLMLEEVRGRAEDKVWVPIYSDYKYDPQGLVE